MIQKLALAILIFLSCVSLSTAFSVHQSTSGSIPEQAPLVTEEFYCPWLYRIDRLKGPAYYGWQVNNTLMLVSYQLALKFFNFCGGQFYSYGLWDTIPKHPLQMNDPLMMFYHVQPASPELESDTFLIINGTKWPITGGMNQTISSGVKRDMIAIGSAQYLQNYPTGMYLIEP